MPNGQEQEEQNLMDWWNSIGVSPTGDSNIVSESEPEPDAYGEFGIKKQSTAMPYNVRGMDPIEYKKMIESENEKKKQEEISRIQDEDYINQKANGKVTINEWINNDDNVLQALDYDLEDKDLLEFEGEVIDWSNIYNKDPETGGDVLYNKIAKKVKELFGEQKWWGLEHNKDNGFEKLRERDIDSIVKEIIQDKATIQTDKQLKEQVNYLANEIRERDLTIESVEELYKQKKLKQLIGNDKINKAIYDKLQFIREARENPEVTDGMLDIYQEELQELLSQKDEDYKLLYSWDGSSINNITEDPDAIQFSEEEIAALKDQIKDLDNPYPTYEEHIKKLFNKNSRDLAYHDFKGETMYDVTIHANVGGDKYNLLRQAGYKPMVGEDGIVSGTKEGYQYKLPLDFIAKNFHKLTADESGYEGNIFTSKRNYFGLTNTDEDQEYTKWEHVFGSNPISELDLSRNFKNFVLDHKNNRSQLIKEGKILSDMHLLNLDPTTKVEGGVEETWDAFKRGGEMIADGFGQDAKQWFNIETNEAAWSNRREKDILQNLEDQYGGILTDNMKEELKRSTEYRIWEGVTGFVPALTEFWLIDVAAKKVGLFTGIPKLAHRLGKAAKGVGATKKVSSAITWTANHTARALFEEAKMATAFDELYHTGGGAAFYGIGRALPMFYKGGNSLWNTFANEWMKGGVAGMLSTKGAANLEALVNDLRGNETYRTFLNETYFDENGEFKLGEELEQSVIDFFVFSLLNLKGVATPEGRLKYRPNLDVSLFGKRRIQGLESLAVESKKLANAASLKIKAVDNILQTSTKDKFELEGKTYNTKEFNALREKYLKDFTKWHELSTSVENRLYTLRIHEDWSDDVKATKMLNRSGAKILKLFNEPDLKFHAVKEPPEWAVDKDAAAEYVKGEGIWVNTTKASPGKLPHEVVHITMRKIFERNPQLADRFKASLRDIFNKVDLVVVDPKTGEQRPGNLDKFIEANYGKKSDAIKAEEYLAYAVEMLANPKLYSQLVTNDTWVSLKTELVNFGDKHGFVNNDINTKEDLIRFLYGFAQGVKGGNLTMRQIKKLQGMEEQGNLFAKEGVKVDNRKPEEIAESDAYAFASQSKDLKLATQNEYTKLKEKYNNNMDLVVNDLIKPDPNNRTSVAGKHFDDIVYGAINIYNKGRIAKGLEKQQVLDPEERYMLATELVLDLSNQADAAAKGKTIKNRGLVQIIKDYDPNLKGKDGKPLTLTEYTMGVLLKRIYAMKTAALDKKGGYETISLSEEGVTEKVEKQQAATEPSVDFMLDTPGAKSKKEIIVLDGKKYNYPLNINEVLGIPNYTPVKTKQVIDGLPVEKITFYNIGKELTPDVKKSLHNAIGVTPDMKPAQYVEIARKWIKENEQLTHELLPDFSNPELYENSQIGKTIFNKLFKGTGEFFKSSELPDHLTKETNARTEKFEKENYIKGKIEGLIFKGNRSNVMKANFEQLLNQISKVNAAQMVRPTLNTKVIQDLIKQKDLNKFVNLTAKNVIPYVKEAIRGATPKAAQSYEFEVWDKFERAVESVDHTKYPNLVQSLEHAKSQLSIAEQKIIDKYMDIVKNDKGYNLSKDLKNEWHNLAQAHTRLQKANQKIVDIISRSSWKKYSEELKENLPKEVAESIDFSGKWLNDKNSIKEYDTFIKDLLKTMPKEFANSQVVKAFIGIGAGKTTFLGERRNNPYYKKNFENLGEGKDKTPWVKDIKATNPGYFKNNKVNKLLLSNKYKNIKNSSKLQKEFANELKKYLSVDGTVKGYEKTLKANEQALEYIADKLFDYYAKAPNKGIALNNLYRVLQIQTSIYGGIRGLATHDAISLNKGVKHSEHDLQLLNLTTSIVDNIVKNAGSKKQFLTNIKPLITRFRQSVIDKDVQVKYDADGKTLSYVTDTKTSTKENWMRERVIAETTLDLFSGKTFDKLFLDAKQAADLFKVGENLKEKLAFQSKDLTISEAAIRLRNIDEALRLAKDPNKKRKGISVIDFDDTLAITDSRVIVKMKDGKTVKWTPAEFAKNSEKSAELVKSYDFSEFNQIKKGKKGPFFDKAKSLKEKFGNQDIFILTARPPGAAPAIQAFLKGVGLDIKLKNIVGLEDGRPEAKANWILEKAAKGYNDFLFADDQIKNVKAVKEVLDIIDVKSNVQQAMQSKNLDIDINDMIERSTGIGSEKRYSDSKAKVMGGKSGKLQLMSSSAQDFEGLIYRLYGKGKQGNKDMAWAKENLLKPWAIANFNISRDKMAMINDFRAAKDQLVKTGIPRNLRKELPGEPYSIEQAVRVYTWQKQGFEIPDLSKADLKTMVDYVEKNPALVRFSQQLIDLGKGTGYLKPEKDWLAGTITTDLHRGLNEKRRPEYLKDWQRNVDVIFSKENMNKLEAAYGTNYRKALENMLQRMRTGRNRPILTGELGKIENLALDWVNNSVGAIMFLNTRSAVLQTISTLNYVNWHDNNPMHVAKTIVNQKQYWKDYVKLFNSDFMVERRGGLQINVAESEIADAASKSRNSVNGVISYLLNKGFILTRAADSHAIASGGASFYRNRINTYLKQGLSEKKAEEKAFNDFRELTEEAQQSSRVDRISMQQASALGRVVLAFANTPSQYARLMMRAVSDLKNGRGDAKSNISKIAYYAFVQNVIFNALQNALFVDAFDEEEGLDRSRLVSTANGMADSLLRGFGWPGAAISALKNWALNIHKQSQKKRPRYADTALSLLDISPPIDSKVAKLRSAGLTLDYDMDEIQEKGFSLDNPAYLASGQVISALSNVPLDRVFKKYDNISAALSEDTENWQKIALLLGWNEWQLQVLSDEDKKVIKKALLNKKIYTKKTY